jgi:signal peptidase
VRITTSTRGSRKFRTWYDSPWRIAGRAVAAALAVALIALIAAVAVVPRLTGGASLTVLSGSMEPTIAPGDVAVVRGITPDEVCAEVGVGTVVAFLPWSGDPTLVTHRVVAKSVGTFDDGTRCRLTTQGDANTAPDAPISPAQVRGVLLYSVPLLGRVRELAGDHLQGLRVVAGVLLLGVGLWSAVRGPRTRVHLLAADALAAAGVDGTPAGHPHGRRGGRRGWTSPDLHARELDLWEREIALREQELAHARATAGPGAAGPGAAGPGAPAGPGPARTGTT